MFCFECLELVTRRRGDKLVESYQSIAKIHDLMIVFWNGIQLNWN